MKIKRTLISASIIGGAIIGAAYIIVSHLPRYQYGQYEDESRDENGVITRFTTAYVFDMVTGELWSSLTETHILNDQFRNFLHPHSKSQRSIIEGWETRKRVFPNGCTSDEWKQWRRSHW